MLVPLAESKQINGKKKEKFGCMEKVQKRTAVLNQKERNSSHVILSGLFWSYKLQFRLSFCRVSAAPLLYSTKQHKDNTSIASNFQQTNNKFSSSLNTNSNYLPNIGFVFSKINIVVICTV